MLTDSMWVTGWLRVDGKRLDYRRSTHGTGIPIVHVHGFAISGKYLMPTARELARRRLTVVPDLPGYGRSEPPERVLGIPALAESLLVVLDALEIETAVIVGNSMGCTIGLEVAHAAPDRVHRLVLVSPSGELQGQPLLRTLGRLALDGLRESPEMLAVALADYARFGPLNTLNLFREISGHPSLLRLVSTPVPTLVVLGGRDPLMPAPNRVREIAALSPEDLAVVLVEAAAHAVNFSHPKVLAGTIDAWLDERLSDGTELPAGVRVVIEQGGTVRK